MSALVLCLYGPLRLICADGSPCTAISRRGQGMLAYFALQPGQRAERARLADLLCSERFDDRLDDLFDLQGRIAEQVAVQLSPSLRAAEIAAACGRPPSDRNAYDLTLRALPHFRAHQRSENAWAINLLDQALDPFRFNMLFGRGAALYSNTVRHDRALAYIARCVPANPDRVATEVYLEPFRALGLPEA